MTNNIWFLRAIGPISIAVVLFGWACEYGLQLSTRYQRWVNGKLEAAWAKK